MKTYNKLVQEVETLLKMREQAYDGFGTYNSGTHNVTTTSTKNAIGNRLFDIQKELIKRFGDNFS